MTKTVFYSFHYGKDVHRVQLVRNVNALEGQPLLNSQKWEEVRRQGNKSIQAWIDKEMSYKRVVIVLIGSETATREWVLYEIQRAWTLKKPLLGIRIHGLSSLGVVDTIGPNPFDQVPGVSGVPIFDPTESNWQGRIDSRATYNTLTRNLETWSDKGRVRLW